MEKSNELSTDLSTNSVFNVDFISDNNILSWGLLGPAKAGLTDSRFK